SVDDLLGRAVLIMNQRGEIWQRDGSSAVWSLQRESARDAHEPVRVKLDKDHYSYRGRDQKIQSKPLRMNSTLEPSHPHPKVPGIETRAHQQTFHVDPMRHSKAMFKITPASEVQALSKIYPPTKIQALSKTQTPSKTHQTLTLPTHEHQKKAHPGHALRDILQRSDASQRTSVPQRY
ncbi:MAG: hypothetical protein AAGJ35_05005, partial [Myxococcota bacterium]